MKQLNLGCGNGNIPYKLERKRVRGLVVKNFAIHGMHDDAWVSAMRIKYPDSLVFRALDDPASLTEQEMRTAVAITGDAEIALVWERSQV